MIGHWFVLLNLISNWIVLSSFSILFYIYIYMPLYCHYAPFIFMLFLLYIPLLIIGLFYKL
ncbi:hypothetical protein BC941DRAFT_423876 [Chlamydoabsidia padenii]|nr:hypothetical protein BC941DRAFT_423876 [Chlamydoabsidia padenii]